MGGFMHIYQKVWHNRFMTHLIYKAGTLTVGDTGFYSFMPNPYTIKGSTKMYLPVYTINAISRRLTQITHHNPPITHYQNAISRRLTQ